MRKIERSYRDGNGYGFLKHFREIAKARESKSEAIRDARLDAMLEDALRNPEFWTFEEMLTDADMAILREMHISWR